MCLGGNSDLWRYVTVRTISRNLADFHLSRDADVTVAAIPVPIGEASSFGVMATDVNGWIRKFQEKPRHPRPIPGAPGRAYASMGNYLFKPSVLAELLDHAARRHGFRCAHHAGAAHQRRARARV